MEISVNVGGTLTDPFEVETGVKQGDLLAPTLFSLQSGNLHQIQELLKTF